MVPDRVLVTGAAGAIGGAVVREFVRRGFEVDAWDRVACAASDSVRPAAVDLLDVVPEPADGGYRVVAHLAACTENRDDRSRLADHAGTVAMTANVLDAVSAAPPQVVLLTSSQLVYDASVRGPDESSPVRPATAFAAAKLGAEGFLEAFGQRSGVRTVVLRLANVIGPATDRGVVHDFVRRAAEAPADGVHVDGSTHHRRAFLSLDDCAAALAHLAVADERSGHELFNVANSDSVSIAAIAAIVADVTGVPFITDDASDQLAWQGDPGSVLPSTRRLLATGWAPRATSGQVVRAAAEAIRARYCR